MPDTAHKLSLKINRKIVIVGKLLYVKSNNKAY